MKNKLLWAGAITLLLAAFVSCSEKEDPALTSLTLTVDRDVLSVTSTESFHFTVKGNDEQNYTEVAEFYVDGNPITGNSYPAAGNVGNHTVYAKVGNVTSNNVPISVTAIELTSLELSVDNDVLLDTSDESFNFTVEGNNEQDYTAVAEFYVDGDKIDGSSYPAIGNLGTHTVVAKVDGITSNELTIAVVDTPPESLELSVDKEYLLETSTELFNFTVIGNNGINYTSVAEIYVDGNKISATNYPTAGNSGVHTVYAKLDDITSNTVTFNIIGTSSNFTSITLSANISDPCPMLETVIFSAVGKVQGIENDLDITSLITVYVNGTSISTTSYVFPADGNYTVYAKVGTHNSNTLNISAQMPDAFVHKVLIEDYTGTWCGWCTRVLHAMDLVHDHSSGKGEKVVVAAIHGGSGDPWPLGSPGSQWASYFGVTGYPTAFLNRTAEWNTPEYSYVNQVIDMVQPSAKQGIAISSTLGASNGTINVTIFFAEAVANAKCVVYVLEDNLIKNQVNYYYPGNPNAGGVVLYGGANPLVNFNHKNVVRTSVTNILGNNSAIPAENSVAGGVYQQTFTANYTSSNVANLKVMVMLLNSVGKGRVVNVQVAPANTTFFERLD